MLRVKYVLQVDAPYFCAGLVLLNDVVIDAAPILKYMRHWSRYQILTYCRFRGWKIKGESAIPNLHSQQGQVALAPHHEAS